jgi:imidazolonepropionase-like amidohydrolase
MRNEDVAGLGVRWQMWGKVKDGATPWQALRDATLRLAETMGVERDLGSLELGKRADFVVLDRDPLIDVRNTDAIRFVVKGGVVYDAASMGQLWPERKALNTSCWQSDEEW